MATRLRPPFISQEDGSRCQYDNCGLAVNCMMIWRHLEGLDPKKRENAPWPPTPRYLRNVFTPDKCGGTSLNDNQFLANEYYGAEFVNRWDFPMSEFSTMIRSGRGAQIRIMYSALHGTKFDHSPNFDGSHGVYVHDYSKSSDRYLVADPLAEDYAWWSASLLARAASAASGPGLIDANFTRDTEGYMIPITEDVPKYVTIAAGKQIYYPDGTKYRLASSKIYRRLSPYETTVAGVKYRIIRAVANDQRYIFMVRTADCSIEQVALSVA